MSEDERREAIRQVPLAAGFKEEQVGGPGGDPAVVAPADPAEVAPGPSLNGDATYRLPYGPREPSPGGDGPQADDDVNPLF
jgi:hypothetical protein